MLADATISLFPAKNTANITCITLTSLDNNTFTHRYTHIHARTDVLADVRELELDTVWHHVHMHDRSIGSVMKYWCRVWLNDWVKLSVLVR